MADNEPLNQPAADGQDAEDILREIVLEMDRSIALYGHSNMTQDLLDLHGKASRFLCIP
jgi:hypothetical protein